MTFDKLKGIYPGRVLEQELKKRCLESSEFAALLNEPSEELAAIINGRKPIYTALSLKVEKYFSMKEGYFMLL